MAKRPRQNRQERPRNENYIGENQRYTPFRNPTPEQKAAWNKAALEGKARKRAAGEIAPTRLGIPDGFTRDVVERVWKHATEDAKRIIELMIEREILDENAFANEALIAAVSIVRAPHHVPADNPGQHIVSVKDKLAAARLVLEYTKAKPAQQIDHTVKSVNEQLDDLWQEIEATPVANQQISGPAKSHE